MAETPGDMLDVNELLAEYSSMLSAAQHALVMERVKNKSLMREYEAVVEACNALREELDERDEPTPVLDQPHSNGDHDEEVHSGAGSQ